MVILLAYLQVFKKQQNIKRGFGS